MAQTNKTVATDASVAAFLDGVASEQQRADSWTLVSLMEEITGEPATMWGPSIVGFGSYTYRYESGRSGEFLICGFSPRKAAISVYLPTGHERHAALLDRLGKHTTGKSCLYIKKLSDIDMNVMRELVEAGVSSVRTSE
ncbi:MAG: DUF1801 domain-containing protein [Thermomicrobiales bacterium]|nr:DUF1801 domain-containing protein [Thermomicrobiales bacterium]